MCDMSDRPGPAAVGDAGPAECSEEAIVCINQGQLEERGRHTQDRTQPLARLRCGPGGTRLELAERRGRDIEQAGEFCLALPREIAGQPQASRFEHALAHPARLAARNAAAGSLAW